MRVSPMAFLVVWAPCWLLLAALVGCGGGGGTNGGSEGAGSPPPRSGAQQFTADYVPLSSGDRRTWLVSTGSASPVQSHERVGVSAQRAGLQAFEVSDETGAVEYFARTNDGLFAVAGPGSDDLTGAAGLVELMRFGLAAGQSAVLFDRTLSFDVDGDRRVDSVVLRVTFSVVGFEAISTPAASWPQAARVRTELRSTIALASGGSGTVVSTADEWYVQGIGLVRASTTTQAGSDRPETQSQDIVAWGVGNLRSESVAPRLLTAAPVDGSISQVQPQLVRLEFSEALDPIGLRAETGIRLLRPDGSVVATTLSLLNGGTAVELLPSETLGEGRYAVRLGSGLVDLANNALGARDLSFAIDMSNPRLQSSQPQQDDQEVALTGTLSLTFNEDLVAVAGQDLYIDVGSLAGPPFSLRLPATLVGRTLSAPLTTPLPFNRLLQMAPRGNVADRAGNPLPIVDIGVRFRTITGPLASPQPLVEGTEVLATRLGDIDGDGRADLVFAGFNKADFVPYLGMRPGLAGGGFGAVRQLVALGNPLSCEAREFVLGDFDGDGRVDVALACSSFLRVYMQTAPGSFVMERPGWNGSSGFGVGDFNGDGRVDLILQGVPAGTDVGAMRAWYAIARQASGGWALVATPGQIGTFASSFASTFADIDNDGRPEPVWLHETSDGRKELAWAPRLALGFGTTQTREAFSSRSTTTSLTVGDFDGDGVADVFYAAWLNDVPVVVVQRGLGGGRFASPLTLRTDYDPYGMKLGDIDGDGRLDLIVNHRNRTVGVYLQTTAGIFAPERLFETAAVELFSGDSLLVVDVNNDGRNDLVGLGDVLLRRPYAQAWPAGSTEPGRARALGSAPAARGSLLRRQSADLPR